MRSSCHVLFLQHVQSSPSLVIVRVIQYPSVHIQCLSYIYIYIIPLNIKCLTFLPLHVWLARVMSRRRSRTHCMPGDRTMPMTVLSHLSAAVRAAVRASSVYLATPLSELEHSCATTGEGVEQTQPTWKIRASTDASL